MKSVPVNDQLFALSGERLFGPVYSAGNAGLNCRT